MAKQQKPKVQAPTPNDMRKKKSKQNPRPNNFGATGRTTNGYKPEAVERRLKRRAKLDPEAISAHLNRS